MTRRRGFTLVEIMIVVLIIGIIVAIAVPNWIQARETSRKNSCIENLKQIDSAKEQWAMSSNQPSGAAVLWSDLLGPGNFLKGNPSCNGGGTYTLNVIGVTPTCSLAPTAGHVIP